MSNNTRDVLIYFQAVDSEVVPQRTVYRGAIVAFESYGVVISGTPTLKPGAFIIHPWTAIHRIQVEPNGGSK